MLDVFARLGVHGLPFGAAPELPSGRRPSHWPLSARTSTDLWKAYASHSPFRERRAMSLPQDFAPPAQILKRELRDLRPAASQSLRDNSSRSPFNEARKPWRAVRVQTRIGLASHGKHPGPLSLQIPRRRRPSRAARGCKSMGNGPGHPWQQHHRNSTSNPCALSRPHVSCIQLPKHKAQSADSTSMPTRRRRSARQAQRSHATM